MAHKEGEVHMKSTKHARKKRQELRNRMLTRISIAVSIDQNVVKAANARMKLPRSCHAQKALKKSPPGMHKYEFSTTALQIHTLPKV